MKTALFTNFTDQEFTGYWDGKGKKFPPGVSLYMPDYLSKHFAKHLTNRELLRTKSDGSLVYKDGDKMTSPKKPEDVPMFMGLFNKAYTPDDAEELGSQKDDIDALIGAANKNRASKVVVPVETKIEDAPPLSSPRQAKPQEDENFAKPKDGQDPTKPQVVLPADWNENDDDDEGSFKGKPVENVPAA